MSCLKERSIAVLVISTGRFGLATKCVMEPFKALRRGAIMRPTCLGQAMNCLQGRVTQCVDKSVPMLAASVMRCLSLDFPRVVVAIRFAIV